MAEWDWEKNNELGLRPDKLTYGSNKKAWWKCSKGHEWQASIYSRNQGNGCPYCSGFYAIKGETDLQTVNPTLAKVTSSGIALIMSHLFTTGIISNPWSTAM